MMFKRLLFIVLVFVGTTAIISAQQYKYIGAAKCKMCHNKPAKGEQYNKWSGLLHANAMKSLKSEMSLDYAKKNNIADPSTDKKCTVCHSTAASIDPSLNGGIKIEEGVSCESCHGPGSAYKAAPVMKNQRLAIDKGLVIPDKALCEKCHNSKNPFHKGFDYETYLAKIDHSDPTN